METGLFRIGELSRRTGVSVDVIRAWERRYALLAPARSEANFRLYSAEDVARLRLMSHYVSQRIAPRGRPSSCVGPSAKRSTSTPASPRPTCARRCARCATRWSATTTRPPPGWLQRLVTVFTPGVVLRDVVIPYLGELGDRWQNGEVFVAQEHFASCFLESWILTVAREYGRSDGRRAVLACLPGERHCLGLAAFGLALRDLGWRVTYLGADAPLASVSDAADAVRADVVVLAVVLAEVLAAAIPELGALDSGHAVVLGGPATCGEPVPGLALPVLPSDVLVAAHALATHARGGAAAPAP